MSHAKFSRIVLRDVRGTAVRLSGVSERTIRRSLFRTLKGSVLCSIATVTGRHQPHINTAYFCYSDDLELYFLSHPRSLHCRHLSRNPSVGMTIFSSSQPWGSPGRGVQLFGRCRQAVGLDARRAERLYAKRFPAYGSWRGGAETGEAGGAYRLYRVVVKSLKLLDEKANGDAVFAYAVISRKRNER